MREASSDWKRLVVCLCVIFVTTSDAVARSTESSPSLLGSITGTVTDASGAVVAQARVFLLNAQQAVLRTTESDAAGVFRFVDVQAGAYEIRVTRVGFDQRRLPVVVAPGAVAQVDVMLEVGRVTEEITITAETGLAQDRERVPQQVNVISERSIQQRTTAVLAQVADEEVGVSLQRTSPTIGAVVVRGLTEVGVYIDGVRFTQSTQRGGINTFFNLNDPTPLGAVEVLRGTNSAQYGADSLGGVVHLVSRVPEISLDSPTLRGEFNSFFTSADLSFGGNTLLSYGTRRFGLLANMSSRRINTLRPGGGIDSHSAITRFLGLPSNIMGQERLPDTAFTYYGGMMRLMYMPRSDQQLSLHYSRGQQDGGKRYDQLLGGDGNLVADLRNLMLDFGYLRYFKQGVGFFDNGSLTVSYNSQREERVNQGGQGNPLAAITHDRERTSSFGFNFFLDKHATRRNTFLIGGDIYRDHVNAPSFSFEPATRAVTLVRPRVPNGARYILAGLFVQDSYEAVPNRVRLSGALRYNVASYRSRAANAPVVRGQPLFPDDSLRAADWSGRIGAVTTVADGLNVVFNYSRGFRPPNITALGSLGLVGVGYQVAATDVIGLNAMIGSTADESAVSTGIPVSPLSSETTNNFDVGVHYRRGRIDTSLTGYLIDYNDTIVRQTLILPPGAVGLRLGSQVIERQLPSGAVFVPLSPAPVLVQVNFGATRMKGVEYELNLRLADPWTFSGHYSYVRAEDKKTGAPPNLGGAGIPPQVGFLRLRYQPQGKRYWVEAYSTLAGRQTRLSSLDLSDRRTGATRSRTSIQNFFRRGACVRGLTTPGTTGQCGSAGGILIPTGETLAQVQNRVLGVGVESAPLFRAIPGYGLINVRGGFRLKENHEISIDFENIGDKSHRSPGWGIDGPGRSVTVRYRVQF
ncbi:MAG: TonB-dependent receptor [Acidobacteriota bacterium]|nr:TonB-dependent receptor [Blastocatellia bacterium]MDW8241186.1 TonB-dependent receptor [Acidobacteriota bacterium]